MPATTLVTSEQYLALPDGFDQNGNRINDELIAGEIVRMPPASRRHDRIKNHINRILIRYLDRNPDLGLESDVEIGTEIGKFDTFVPDISVFRLDQLAGDDRIVRGSPDLAIEVVSPYDTAKHLKSKVDAYLAGGAKSVWIVYPDARSVMVHTPGSVHEVKADQAITDPLLPGFAPRVSEFFERV